MTASTYYIENISPNVLNLDTFTLFPGQYQLVEGDWLYHKLYPEFEEYAHALKITKVSYDEESGVTTKEVLS